MASLPRAAKKEHKDLGLRNEQGIRQAERDQKTIELRPLIGVARIEIDAAAYRHNARGDRGSIHVRLLDNRQTDEFIQKTFAEKSNQSLYRSADGETAHKCVINLGDGETIAFTYYDAGWLLVYHVGPGAPQ